MSPNGTQPSLRPQLRRVLEGLVWVVLVVTAVGAAIVIGVLIDIDCNGLWGERPDRECTSSKSWMPMIPLGVLALLVVARVNLARRTTARRAAPGGGR